MNRRVLGVAALAAALALLSVAAPASASTGLSPVYGFSTATGSFVIPYYQGLLQPYSVSPGATVFGDTVYLEFINSEGNRSVTIETFQHATGLTNLTFNETFSVAGHNETTLTFDLPSSTAARDTRLCVDGGCMAFVHVTPLTLIPSGVLSIGGLDLLVLSLVVEMGALIWPLTLLARWLTHRALWSPAFKAWLWAPHFTAAVLIATVVDFQAFDAVFGGASFILFPVGFALLYFFWVLHLFNRAHSAEVLRPDPQGGHRLRYNRWRILVGELPDGTKVLIGRRWRDWLARLLGHHAVLVPANIDGTRTGGPAEAALDTFRPRTKREQAEAVETVTAAMSKPDYWRTRPGRVSPLDDFRVAGEPDTHEKDAPKWLYWVTTDGWYRGDLPYLSWSREVTVPARYAPDGALLTPATTRRKWTWPHYVEPPAGVDLAGVHYLDTPVAALGLIRAEKAYRRVEDLRNNVGALRATVHVEADAIAEEQHGELLRLLDVESRPLDDEATFEDTLPVGSKRDPRRGDAPPTGAVAPQRTRPEERRA
jgi:hypothetical protein